MAEGSHAGMTQVGAPQPATGDDVRAIARLCSLDAFRGIVIAVMVFVNYLAGVRDIPAWAKHAPDDADAYTFVDVVFPAFLFIVGVAIPLALSKRLARGDSMRQLVTRIFARSASLIFVGVIMVNQSAYSAAASGMSKNLWFLMAMLAIIVLWSAYPGGRNDGRRKWDIALRIAAGVTLAALLFVFRGKNAAGDIVWLQTSWWGILGLIGWAYLVSSLAYLACRGNSAALMGVLGLMLALYIGGRHGALDWLGPAREVINVGQIFGSIAASVMIGMIVGNRFVAAPSHSHWRANARFMLVFGIALYIAGTLLRPLHGINKIAATESYALVTGGICCLCFLAVFLVMDVWNARRWAAPLIPVGENALLAYVLPGVVGNFFGVLGLQKILWPYDAGLPGALNAAALTLVICAITWALTRAGLRFKL
jgi:heparan-alpha-glucosaminide N-acetyltransferase